MAIEMEHAAMTNTTTPPPFYKDHHPSIVVRMHVHPFSDHPVPLIVPDDAHHHHHTPQQLLTAVLSSFVSDDEDDDDNNYIKVAIEAEWNEIFQHWKYILEQERTTVFEKGHPELFAGVLVIATFLFWMLLLDPNNSDTHGMFGGCLVPLCFLWIKDVIRTNIRYSDNSNNNNNNNNSYDRDNIDSRRCSTMHIENDNMDAIPQYRSRMTTNRLLLLVDRMPGIATGISCFGLWVVAIFIVRLKEYYLSGWGFVVAFFIPMAFVSLYVLKHIGGWTSLGDAYRRRDMFGRNRREGVLKKVLHEITRHNDALTYFTVRPQINYYDVVGEIWVDIYQKSTTRTSNGNDFEDGEKVPPPLPLDLLSSVSYNLGVTKRRGGNDHGFIVMIDGSSNEQQQQQLHYDDVHDGLSTPLLTKDTSV